MEFHWTLVAHLRQFFRSVAPLASRERVERLVVAFSGGPDSLALLWGARQIGESEKIEVIAAHLDHAGDPGSAGRAAAAVQLAAELGLPCRSERASPGSGWAGESPEAANRRIRYRFLESVRRESGARWIATGHHLDDQAETVLLRLRFGSGLEGLAGIQPVRGAVVRPLLSWTRRQLAEILQANGLSPLADPTNRELAVPRNYLRHRVLPHLTGEDPELPRRLGRLAERVQSARAALDRRLANALEMVVDPRREGIAVRRAGFLRLPAELRPLALAALHRRAGVAYPAGRPAREELMRQLTDPKRPQRRVGCDCGGGWRWQQEQGGWLALRRASPVSLILFSDPGQEPSPESHVLLACGAEVTPR
jgi:tRNA(Ile)-lysidine synthase